MKNLNCEISVGPNDPVINYTVPPQSKTSSNPLLEPKVVSRVLSQFPHDQLSRLRLVSKIWNDEICRLLHGVDLVVFRTVGDVSRYLTLFKRDSKNIPDNFPYPHSRFHLSKIRLNLIYDNYTLRKFFRTFASQINHLQLEFTGSTFRFKFLRLFILQNLNHLESLVLTLKEFNDLAPWVMDDDVPLLPLNSVSQLTVYGYGRESTLKTMLSKILGALPNLQKIEMGEQLGRLLFEIIYENNPISKVTGQLSTIMLPYLTYLNLHYLFPDQIDTIIQNRLPLKSLKGELQVQLHPSASSSAGSDFQSQKVKALLDCLASTLEDLSLESPSGILFFISPSMPMKFLTSMELRRFTVDLSILDNFPALQSLKFNMVNLTFDNISNNGNNELQCSNVQNDNLHSLTIELCKDLTSKLFQEFGRRFPKLKKLDLPFYILQDKKDNFFNTICDQMINLEELYLSQDSISDEDITGIPQQLCSEVFESWKFGVKSNLVADSSSSFSRKYSSSWIGNLQQLKVLHLKTVKLTDFGVIYGIVHCKKLEKLTLYSPYGLTNLSLRVIADNLAKNLVSLDLFCSNQITDSAISYLTGKMKGRRCIISENQFRSLGYNN